VSGVGVVVHRDPELLAEAVAARLAIRLIDAQSVRGRASVVLTGGGLGIALLRALRDGRLRDAVDWRRLDVWWGDERFLPAGDGERNETQARDALLDHVPLDPARVHPMPASDGPDGNDVEAAAERYAGELAAAAKPEHHLPHFDVLLLGMGGEGHVASIFPESPAAYDERPVVGVRGSPKPPPSRVSLTFPTINSADEVWLVVAGADKAGAVGLALGAGAGPTQVPAAGVGGHTRTLWLLDRAAAKDVPADLRTAH
jgi:6-phosphogluconolactonase